MKVLRKYFSPLALSAIVCVVSPLCASAAQSDIDNPPFPIAGKFSRTIQSVTGLTWLSGVLASQGAKHVLRRQLGSGVIKVKVKPYSFTDLLSGKIKYVDVKIERCLIKTVPLGTIELSNANPLWYDPGFRKHVKGLRSPIMFNVTGHLNKDQITTALNNPKVSSAIRGLKLDLPGLGSQQIEIVRPDVQISDDALQVHALLITKGAPEETGVPVTISGRPTVEGPKIYLRDLQVDSPDIPNPEEFAKFTDELFNPIYDLGRLDRKTHAFRVTGIKFRKDTVDGTGTLVLAPKPGKSLAEAPPTKRRWFRAF